MDERSSENLLNVPEVAERLGMSPGTIYHMVSEGRIPSVHLSKRCVRFRPSEIEKWLDKQTTPVRAEHFAVNSRQQKKA